MTLPTDVLVWRDGKLQISAEPALTALNARLSDDYIADAGKAFKRWNRIIKKAGIDFELTLPHRAFNRRVGQFADAWVTPLGQVTDKADWESQEDNWLPTQDDMDYVRSLMTQITEPGKFASWISPPKTGIDNRPGDFEYVVM